MGLNLHLMEIRTDGLAIKYQSIMEQIVKIVCIHTSKKL